MGIEAYRVRSSRLAKFLESAHGIKLTASESLRAIAAEEGIPRANWNELAARAKNEPVESNSELIVGESGSGKSVYAQRCAIEALAASRAVLVIAFKGDHRYVEALGGSIHTINPDGSRSVKIGTKSDSKLVLLEFDMAAPTNRDGSTGDTLPSLKELGFSRPDVREIVVIADDCHRYGKSDWFFEILGTIAENECAEVKLIVQMFEDITPEAIVAGGIQRLRLFRMPRFVAEKMFGEEVGGMLASLPRGTSFEHRFAFPFPDAKVPNSEVDAIIGNVPPTRVHRGPPPEDFEPTTNLVQVIRDRFGWVTVLVGENASDEILANIIGPKYAGMIARVLGVDGHDVQTREAWNKITALWQQQGVESVVASAQPQKIIVDMQQAEPAQRIEMFQEGKVISAMVGDGVSDADLKKWISVALRQAPEVICFFVGDGRDVTARASWNDIAQNLTQTGHKVAISRPAA